MKTIIMLMPYFGNWPEWFNLYLETCKQNTTINWLFFTDCPEPENKCLNVRYIRMSFEEFRKYAGEKLGFPLNMSHPYKICDLRVAFGVIFDEYIAGYDYWGFGDIDLLYGNIRKFLTDNILRYNVISFHSHSLSGSFSCFKNNLELKYMYRYLNNWQDKLSRDNWYDELDKLLGKILIKKEGSYFIESFNAPGANGIPWVDGTYIYPTEWYWSDGRLINNRDGGREFLYFHFMLWKGGKWGRLWRGGQWENLKKIVHFHYKEATDGWRVNKDGFFLLEKRQDNKRFYPKRSKKLLIKAFLWRFFPFPLRVLITVKRICRKLIIRLITNQLWKLS